MMIYDSPDALKIGKLIVAVMSSERDLMHEVEERLHQRFGGCDLRGDVFSFDHFSFYYAKEMGYGLQKRFLSFDEMIRLDTLASIKLYTNGIEQEYARNGCRRVNIDPGYLTHAQMVLATTKDYSHRIYLGKGIHAELTYIISKHGFRSLEWTYPDYREEWAKAFFLNVRKMYLQQMRESRERQFPQSV
ncbi:hypothetical protein CSB45_06885 [candidate division KSB3 bacterium]|uniref:GTP-binding protein n=1 Tax=candidate division KSB3 bacterium TaxID=2044937 RepID=A0A2G6E6H5_9BACT|nr:MAG: hypothetical protein CSB45_06885 [candidate division KSB3 bacterium]PIE30040.1 MAG: hypothetical protein CSA57_05710 [candidate division KSB3 bacterium]